MAFWKVEAYCPTIWKTLVLVAFTCLWITSSTSAGIVSKRGHITSDGCDWNGSGLNVRHESYRTVHPVYLRCRAGRVQWRYPRRALRIVLSPTDGRPFLACFLLHSNSARSAAYIEGASSLRRIFDDQRSLTCVHSKESRLVVFLEARPAFETLHKNLVDFSYDLQTIESTEDECRPCTEKELLYHFCTADFAARGTVRSMRHVHDTQRTELTIRASEVIQDTQQRVFGSTGVNSANDAMLYRSLQCGTKAGQGEFLFLGRWKLDKPTITCAPRWKEWKKVKQRALLAKTSDCLLS